MAFRIKGKSIPNGLKTVQRNFLSRDAAEAFIEGLAYVNDYEIGNIKLIEKPHGDFAVRFTDGDAK